MSLIYVVEDNPDILEVSRIILEQEGFTIKTCLNSYHLFDELENMLPDLILLDFRLRRGIAEDKLIRKLKGDKRYTNVPVLVYSADHKVEEKALKAGADGFLAKPFDIEDLLKAIKKRLPQ